MADALASGASGSNTVWVQVPSSALNNGLQKLCLRGFAGFLLQKKCLLAREFLATLILDRRAKVRQGDAP